MTKFIVHAGTDTIIDASDDVYILDIEDITDEDRENLTGSDYFDDHYIIALAKERGNKLNPDTLEMTFGNTVSFAPSAIKEEAQESDQLKHVLGEEIISWLLSDAKAEDFAYIAGIALGDDEMWQGYNQTIASAIQTAYENKEAK